MSTLEQKIINSTEPIHLPPDHEIEEITFLNKPSIWLNKKECNEWQGPVSLNSYKLNEDPNPDIIIKKIIQPVEYTQDIQIKYLQPPTPPPDGDLIIQQEKDIILDPLPPPQIIRVYPPRPRTPPPLIIREKPPQPRPPKPVQIITIPGRVIRPPQRRQIIIEHMPQVASRQIIIEKPKYYSEFIEKKNLIFKQNLKNLNYLDIEIKVPKSNRVEIQIDHLNNHNQCCSNRREIWTTSKTISYKSNWNNCLSKTNNIDSSFMRFHENLKKTFWS
jgi:hypothetical protein